MKKRIFNQTTTPQNVRGPGQCLVSLYPKSGNINFSKKLSEVLKLNDENQRINIIQDEDRPKDWYIELTSDADGFTPRVKKAAKYNQYVIQNSHLCRLILKECGLPEETVAFVVATEPVQENLFAIITKSADKKK